MRNCSPKVSLLVGLSAAYAIVHALTGETKQNIETRVKKIAPEVIYKFDRNLRPGAIRKVDEGRIGTVSETFEVTYEAGTAVEFRLLDREVVESRPTVYHISKSGYSTSRGSFVRGEVRTMSASAYDPNPRGGTGRTSLGHRAKFGHVAVDPKVIPLGSLLYIEGYGFALASDTGGAIKGNRIDLCYNSRAQAFQFGRRKVKVHVLKPQS
jgi:3D (Asp-Asp-Asp) domain-containing protein